MSPIEPVVNFGGMALQNGSWTTKRQIGGWIDLIESLGHLLFSETFWIMAGRRSLHRIGE